MNTSGKHLMIHILKYKVPNAEEKLLTCVNRGCPTLNYRDMQGTN
uniref:Uncharacterized protein n=1 Tax=Anguilla anguilla TaxID=7936 RepID=A0A0E9T4J7_ANGAN